MKSEPGPPMTLGNAAAARVRLIVRCKVCGYQVEPDPAAVAARYGALRPFAHKILADFPFPWYISTRACSLFITVLACTSRRHGRRRGCIARPGWHERHRRQSCPHFGGLPRGFAMALCRRL